MSNATKKLNNLDSYVKQLTQVINQLNHRLFTVEQSNIILSKTANALLQELIAKKIINDTDIVQRIRIQEDELQRTRIQQMLSNGLIKAVDTVNEYSLVIVSTAIVKGESVVPLVEYFAIDMRVPNDDIKFTSQLLNKKVGDKIETEMPPAEHLIVEIKEIYTLVEGTRPGEVDEAQQSSVDAE